MVALAEEHRDEHGADVARPAGHEDLGRHLRLLLPWDGARAASCRLIWPLAIGIGTLAGLLQGFAAEDRRAVPSLAVGEGRPIEGPDAAFPRGASSAELPSPPGRGAGERRSGGALSGPPRWCPVRSLLFAEVCGPVKPSCM